MDSYDEIAALVKSGHSTVEIAERLNLAVSDLADLLHAAIGMGLVTRSDILFTFDNDVESWVEVNVENCGIENRSEFLDVLASDHVEPDAVAEALLYYDLREGLLPDMYGLLRNLERQLHKYIRETLEGSVGAENFWRKLPLKVRTECAQRREEDDDPQDDLYVYTTFIHLRDIFDKEWRLLSKNLPKKTSHDKQGFLLEFVKINKIRNRVMHPIYEYRPTRRDFEFVLGFAGKVSGKTMPGSSEPTAKETD